MSIAESNRPFHIRIGRYLAERFPIGSNGIAALVLGVSLASAATGNASGMEPDAVRLLGSGAVVLAMFLILRICDEHKDAVEDAMHRPERPVPRGLVSLWDLRLIAIATAVLQAAVVLAVAPWAFTALLVVWGWTALMTKEFFVGERLKSAPVAYLISHMLVMPLVALLAGATGSGALEVLHAPSTWGLATIAFVAGIVMEIGRKIWDAERPGVQTYSGLWGRQRAVVAWHLVASLLLILTSCFQIVFLQSWMACVPIFVLAVIHFSTIFIYRSDIPQKLIETMSSIIVLIVLVSLGAAPWLS